MVVTTHEQWSEAVASPGGLKGLSRQQMNAGDAQDHPTSPGQGPKPVG